MKKVYKSAIRPKAYTIISLLVSVFLLTVVFVGFKYLYFWKLLCNIDQGFLLILILFFLVIFYIYKTAYYWRIKKMVVVEVDNNGLFYYTKLNKSQYIYYIQMKDIYIDENNKLAVVFINNTVRYIKLPVSDSDLEEIVSIVRVNLLRRGN